LVNSPKLLFQLKINSKITFFLKKKKIENEFLVNYIKCIWFDYYVCFLYGFGYNRSIIAGKRWSYWSEALYNISVTSIHPFYYHLPLSSTRALLFLPGACVLLIHHFSFHFHLFSTSIKSSYIYSVIFFLSFFILCILFHFYFLFLNYWWHIMA